MSYYKPPVLNLTEHAQIRICQRLKITGSLTQRYEKILDLYNASFLDFKVGNTSYLKISPKNNFYFIVTDNVVITFSEISYSKKIRLLE